MRIAVIGAGGRTGIEFVKAALAAGYEVNAGIHNNNPYGDEPDLHVIKCDSTSIDDVRTLFKGQDAVISLIGHVQHSLASVQTDSIKTVITVMNEQGIKRLISLTGTGVRFEGDQITLVDRFLNAGIGLIDPTRIKDGKDHVELIKRSNLDWTIVRVLKLQDIAVKSYILKPNGPTKIIVGRKEVAAAILEVLENNTFIHEAPIVGA